MLNNEAIVRRWWRYQPPAPGLCADAVASGLTASAGPQASWRKRRAEAPGGSAHAEALTTLAQEANAMKIGTYSGPHEAQSYEELMEISKKYRVIAISFEEGEVWQADYVWPPKLQFIRLAKNVLAPGTVLPNTLYSLDMNGADLPDGAGLPDSLQVLYLNCTKPYKHYPRTLRYLFVRVPELPQGLVLPPYLSELDLGPADLPPGTILPNFLFALTMRGGKLPEGTVLPSRLGKLYMYNGSTIPEWTELPESLFELHLGGTPLPAGTKLPENLRHLDLGGAQLPPGTVLPPNLEVFRLGGAVLTDDIVLPPRLIRLDARQSRIEKMPATLLEFDYDNETRYGEHIIFPDANTF